MFRPKVQGHLGRAPPGWPAHPTPEPSCLHRVAAGQPPMGVEQDLGHSCPPPPTLHVTVYLRLGLSFQFCFLVGDPWDSSHPHPSLCPPVLSQAGRGSPSRARGQPVLAEGGQAGSPGVGRQTGGPPHPFRGVGVRGGGLAAPPSLPSWCLDSRPGHSRGGPGPGLPPLAEQRVPGACWGSRLL